MTRQINKLLLASLIFDLIYFKFPVIFPNTLPIISGVITGIKYELFGISTFSIIRPFERISLKRIGFDMLNNISSHFNHNNAGISDDG